MTETPSSLSSDYLYQPAGDFSDLSWLFRCDNRNRDIIRQNFDEAALLWRAIRNTRGPILEIGRRHGGTTVLLLEAAKMRPVTSIDLAPQHHPECEAYFRKIAASEPQRLELLVGDSRQALPHKRFGALFIDGDHSYEGVRDDVRAHWDSLHGCDGFPPLAIFHDAIPNDGLIHNDEVNHCEGVRRVCGALLAMGCAQVVEAAGSSVVLEKLENLPAGAFIKEPPSGEADSGGDR